MVRYNQSAKPFLWTKSKVHQKRLRPCFADPRFRVLEPWAAWPRPTRSMRR
jgi:hypothetical protein